MNQCPECSKSLSIKKIGCSCGWSKPSAKVEIFKRDPRCEYQSYGVRCPLPGTVSPSPYRNDQRYCSGHRCERDNPSKSEELLRYNIDHYAEIMEKRRSWRDKLFEVQPQERE